MGFYLDSTIIEVIAHGRKRWAGGGAELETDLERKKEREREREMQKHE